MPALTYHRAMGPLLPVRLLAVLFISGLGSVVMTGCVGPVNYARTINETAERYVKLVADDRRGQTGTAERFDHPLVLSETNWAQLLNGLYTQARPKWFLSTSNVRGGSSLALNEADRGYLARYLAEAFSKARPDHWVVFYLSQPREPGVTEITSGGFFVERGLIHLVLANYRQPISMSFIQQQIWSDPLRPAGDSFYDLIPQEHQTIRADGRWAPMKPLSVPVPELVIDYRAALTLPRARAPINRPGGSQTEIGHEEGTSLEDKLRTLQRLREQGLITEQEHMEKRQKLLEAF